MANGGVVNFKIHHGDTFTEEGVLTYIGGGAYVFRNLDVDRLSYFELLNMAKDVGFTEGDKLYYTISGYSLDGGIDQIHNDESVMRMLRLAKPNVLLEIYIQHADQHGVSGNANVGEVGEAMEDVNMDKIKGKKKKSMVATKRDERSWSAEEETLLVDILYDMNISGWKVDTCHKSGYLSFIEKEIAKKLPNSDIKVDPHIKSKVKVMKKHLTYILEIQQYGSGFGWDDEHKMVTGARDIFMGWAKKRDGASSLWMKPMIHYDKLVEIYANDLAKGSKVKGPGDESELDEDQSTKNRGEVGTQVLDESGSQFRANTTPSSSRQSLKRKASDNDPLEAKFIQISKSISSLLEAEKESALTINEIKKAFTHEVDVHEQISGNRKELFQVLCALPGLTPEQVVKATRLIGQDTAKMDLFFPMPDDYKVIFVRQEIDGSH